MWIRADLMLVLAVLGGADLQNLPTGNGGPLNNVIEIVYQMKGAYCNSRLETYVNHQWEPHLPDICHRVSNSSCSIHFESKCLDLHRIKAVIGHLPDRNIEDIFAIMKGSNMPNIEYLDSPTVILTSKTPCELHPASCTTQATPVGSISMTTIATIVGCGLGLVAVTLLGFIALKILRSFNMANFAVAGNARAENVFRAAYRSPNNRYTPMPGEGVRGRPPTLPAPVPFRPPIKKQDPKEEEEVYDFIDPESKGPSEDDGYLRPVQLVGLNVSCSVTTMHEKLDKKSNDDDEYLRPVPLCPDTAPPRRTPEAGGEGRGAAQDVPPEDPGSAACGQEAPLQGPRSHQPPEKKAHDKEADDADDDWEASYMTTIAYVNINLTARTSRVPPADSGAPIREEEEDPDHKYDRISTAATVFRK